MAVLAPALALQALSSMISYAQSHSNNQLRLAESANQLQSLRTRCARDIQLLSIQHNSFADVLNTARGIFAEMLQLYAEQARAYMEEQATYTKAEIEAVDAATRATWRSRKQEIDFELRNIRASALQLHSSMTQFLTSLSGTMFKPNADIAKALALPIGP